MPRLNHQKLLDLMFKRQCNLQNVARSCGVATATLSAIVRGKRTVANIPTVSKIADYFGVSPFELIVQKGAN